MNTPKEIAEKIIKGKEYITSIDTEPRKLARAYLELENKHEYIHNKLLDDIEYQKSEISILKQDLDSEKRNHKIFREAAEGYLKKLKKSREGLRTACEFYSLMIDHNESAQWFIQMDRDRGHTAREALEADDNLMKEV